MKIGSANQIKHCTVVQRGGTGEMASCEQQSDEEDLDPHAADTAPKRGSSDCRHHPQFTTLRRTRGSPESPVTESHGGARAPQSTCLVPVLYNSRKKFYTTLIQSY